MIFRKAYTWIQPKCSFPETRFRLPSIVFQSWFKHQKSFPCKLYANHDSTKYHDRLLLIRKGRTYQTDIIKSIKWTKGLMIRRIRNLSSIKHVSDMQQRSFPKKEVNESFFIFHFLSCTTMFSMRIKIVLLREYYLAKFPYE